MRRILGACLGGACMLASAICTQGQTPAIFSATTRLVEVNVIATDKNGPVEGLTKGDFVIYDNGKKQNAAVFEMNARRASDRPGQPAQVLAPNEFTNRPATGPAEQGNAIMVVWDMLNTSFEDQIRARPAVLQSLRVIRPGDHVGVCILGTFVSVLQDFTSDSSQLIATLDKYAKWPDVGYVLPETRIERTRQAAWEIGNHLARVRGRKSVIWISAKSPVGLFGADFAIYMVDARAIPGFPGIRAAADNGTRTAFDSPPTYDDGSSMPNSPDRELMKQIAASTGGAAFTWGNDIRGAIDRAMTDADVTYTLGFYAEAPAPPAKPYHELKVQVKRRGVDVHYRKSYQTIPYAPPPRRLVADAIASAIDSTQIAIGARLESNGPPLGIPVTIGAGDIVFAGTPARRTGAVDLIVTQRAAGGAELDTVSRSLAIDVDGQNYDEFLKQGIRATIELAPQPGLAEVKVVVLDRNSGHVGSLTIPIKL